MAQVDEVKEFTAAELKRIKAKAATANAAIADHNDFMEFLREQHDALAEDGWLLGDKGFVKPAPGPQQNGVHEMEVPVAEPETA